MCELALPTHLNTELLENALLNAFGEKSVKVLNFQTKPAVASGDNYTSDVFRVLVDYQIKDSEPKQISLIVKYMLEIESVVESLNEYKLFVKEKDVFTNFLPKISALLHEDFGPKCHYITENPQIFVMEDLKDSGFKLLDRQAGLDLEHTKLVVDKLAKYHATSMFLAEQDPEAMELYDFGIINKNAKSGDVIPPHTVHGLASLIEVAATWPDFGDIVEKLKNIKENLAERTVRCIDQKSSFKVLNHGDLWTNNFMIKYDKDDKTPEDVYFIDYQIGYYSSMGIDWNYFMTLSPNNTVKAEHRDLLMKSYYSTLVDTLNNLRYPNSKIPTLKNVEDEIANYEFYGFFATICVLPLILMDRNTGVVSDIEALQEGKGEELRKVQFSGKIFQEAAKILLKRFNDIGALD